MKWDAGSFNVRLHPRFLKTVPVIHETMEPEEVATRRVKNGVPVMGPVDIFIPASLTGSTFVLRKKRPRPQVKTGSRVTNETIWFGTRGACTGSKGGQIQHGDDQGCELV